MQTELLNSERQSTLYTNNWEEATWLDDTVEGIKWQNAPSRFL